MSSPTMLSLVALVVASYAATLHSRRDGDPVGAAINGLALAVSGFAVGVSLALMTCQ